MKSEFDFSMFHIDKLAKVLRMHGCERSEEVAFQMKALAREYHRQAVPLEGGRPAIVSLAEASRLGNHTNEAVGELENLNADNHRRFKRERRRRSIDLSFNEHAKVVNDVYLCAVYAFRKALAIVRQGQAPADVAFRRLIVRLEVLWVRSTGLRLPEVPLEGERDNETWEDQRALERHPIWIVLSELGIDLSAHVLELVISAARDDLDGLIDSSTQTRSDI